MSQKSNTAVAIKVSYFQIGEEKIPTPIGFSELLEPAWSKPQENDPVEEFASQFTWSTFRNSKGRIVFRFERKTGDPK